MSRREAHVRLVWRESCLRSDFALAGGYWSPRWPGTLVHPSTSGELHGNFIPLEIWSREAMRELTGSAEPHLACRLALDCLGANAFSAAMSDLGARQWQSHANQKGLTCCTSGALSGYRCSITLGSLWLGSGSPSRYPWSVRTSPAVR